MIALTDEDREIISTIWHKDHKLLTAALTDAYIAGLRAGLERAARVCENNVAAEYETGKVDHNEQGWTQYCAAAIRALIE